MKKLFYVLVVMSMVCCTSRLYPHYTLTKKYPLSLPDLELKFLTDTTGVVIKMDDKLITQDFEFIKKKHFLVITDIDSTNNLVSLEKGDTIVYYKKELWLFNEQHKLFFNKE